MAIQDAYGRIGFFEDFLGVGAAATLSDATAGTRFNDVTLVAISGDVAMDHTVDEAGGVVSFSGAAGAGDGIALIGGSPFRPSTNGTIVTGGRFKASAVTDYRVFAGLASTASLSETVNPFTLSGTTLTSNDGGSAVGFYYDTQATTDDMRFHASTDGTEHTTATVYDQYGSKTTLGALGIRANATIAADTYMVYKLEMDNDGTVRAWFGDESMARNKGLVRVATLAAGTLSTTRFYFPLLMLLEQSTGDPTHEVDYFYAFGARDWDGTQP